jgi:hypothetical protein
MRAAAWVAVQLCCIRQRRYPRRVHTFPTSIRRWHSLLIGLLLAAVLLKPVLALECVFCADPGRGEDAAAVESGGDDCCLGQGCGDCCAQLTGVVPLERPLSMSDAGTVLSAAIASPYRPRRNHGVFRPPIAA